MHPNSRLGALYQFVVRKPDWVSHIDNLILLKIRYAALYGGPGIRVILLCRRTRGTVIIVQVLIRVRLLRHDFINIGALQLASVSATALVFPVAEKYTTRAFVPASPVSSGDDSPGSSVCAVPCASDDATVPPASPFALLSSPAVCTEDSGAVPWEVPSPLFLLPQAASPSTRASITKTENNFFINNNLLSFILTRDADFL